MILHLLTRCFLFAYLFLAMPLEAMFRIQVPYAAISRVVIHNEGPRLYPQLQFHAASL